VRRLAPAFLLLVWRLAAAADVERLDPRLDAIIPTGAAVERLVDGLAWVEGPVWDVRRGRLLFTDVPRNVVMSWRDGEGARVFLEHAGFTGPTPFEGREPGANGLALDRVGQLLLCEHGDRRVTRLEADGTKTVLADRYEGKRLNSPNDLVVGSNADLYFTDPPFGLPKTFDDPGRELDFSGVYRRPVSGRLELLTRAMRAPNGIALSPDEKTLYVTNADAARPVVLAFPIDDDGSLGPSRVLWNAAEWLGSGPGNPDGIDVDRAGNLFVAGPGAVYVLASDGTLLGRIVTGVATANCAFGAESSALYVAASTALWKVPLATGGRSP
jgi:gluconolactonase